MITIQRNAAYLEHHGIKGQKWGVKNGPPYPLAYDEHSAAEKKKNPKGLLSNEEDNHTGASGNRTAGSLQKSQTGSSTKSSPFEKLSDEQKKRIKTALKVGAIAAGGALAAYGAYKVYSNYTKDSNSIIDPETGFPLIQGEHSPKDDIMALNPGAISTPFGTLDAVTGSTMNCMLCTTNYELRRRGYDVHAGLSTEGFSNELFSEIFEDANVVKPNISSVSELQKHFESSYPEGARGNFMLYYNPPFGGGHSVVWEIENGSLVIRDGQVKIVSESLKKALRFADVSQCEYVRTDNLKIKADVLDDNAYTRSESNTRFMLDNMTKIPANIVNNNLAELEAMGITASALAYGGYKAKSAYDSMRGARKHATTKRTKASA